MMSDGPIQRWRNGYNKPRVSSTNAARVCGLSTIGTPYCGRRSGRTARNWDDVTCADCLAAQRADTAAK